MWLIMKRRNKIIIAVLLLALGFVILSVFVPIYERSMKLNNCGLCGASKSEVTVYIYGIPVNRKRSGIRKNDYTDHYDKYIAEPHEHQWAGGGFATPLTNICGARPKPAGGGGYGGKYPLYHHQLTRNVLSVMEVFEDEPLEFRRQVFHELIECKKFEDYKRAQKLIEEMHADRKNSRKLYDAYHQQKAKQPKN